MHPFLDQYLPTDKARNEADQGMKDAKRRGFIEGDKWTSKYLFHIPLEVVRRKKSREEELDELEDEDDSIHHDDPIGNGTARLPFIPVTTLN